MNEKYKHSEVVVDKFGVISFIVPDNLCSPIYVHIRHYFRCLTKNPFKKLNMREPEVENANSFPDFRTPKSSESMEYRGAYEE